MARKTADLKEIKSILSQYRNDIENILKKIKKILDIWVRKSPQSSLKGPPEGSIGKPFIFKDGFGQ